MTTKDPRALIAEVKARCEAATKKWMAITPRTGAQWLAVLIGESVTPWENGATAADVRLAAHARTDLPALVAHLETALGIVEAVADMDAVEQLYGGCMMCRNGIDHASDCAWLRARRFTGRE